MTNIYPADFVHAEICYNCYSLFEFFCLKRDTKPTDASIHNFGCEAFFDFIDENGKHNCFNCKHFCKNWCVTQKKRIENQEDSCSEFMVHPYFKQHPTGLTIVSGKRKKMEDPKVG